MIYWTAFVLGLVGGLHCAGMCGPLTLLLPGKGNDPMIFFLGRLFYNLGRIATYCIVGLVVGIIGKSLLLAGIQDWVSIGLGIVLLAGLLGSKRLDLKNPAYKGMAYIKSSMSCMIQRRSLLSLVILGLLNGLLPCGLVYVAAAGAITTGGIERALGYMAAFGAGTLPTMLAMSLSGTIIPNSFRLKLQGAIPVTIFFLGILLILRGMSLGIPFISPDMGAPCCHR